MEKSYYQPAGQYPPPMSPYPAAEGLQHISHDHQGHSEGLYHDDRATYQRDGVQAYDKQPYAYTEVQQPYPPATLPEKRVCGLRRKWFWILVIVAVVLVAVIAGGVGGALGSKKNGNAEGSSAANSVEGQSSGVPVPASSTASGSSSSQSSTTTTSSTSSPTTFSTKTTSSTSSTSAPNAPTTTAAALTILGCPSSNGTRYTPPGSSQTFLKYCMKDLQSGTSAQVDIQSRIQPNFNACIKSCAEYTVAWKEGGSVGAGPCAGVAYNALIPSWPYNDLRCFLKADTGGLVFADQVLENIMASALVVS